LTLTFREALADKRWQQRVILQARHDVIREVDNLLTKTHFIPVVALLVPEMVFLNRLFCIFRNTIVYFCITLKMTIIIILF